MATAGAPVVVNLHVVDGKRPGYDIYIGRQLNYPPHTVFPLSKWANPFSFKKHGEHAMQMYEVYAHSIIEGVFPENLLALYELTSAHMDAVMVATRRAFKKGYLKTWDLSELAGKVLGCWCKPGPCHGDVLVKLWEEKYGGDHDGR